MGANGTQDGVVVKRAVVTNDKSLQHFRGKQGQELCRGRKESISVSHESGADL